MLVLSLSSFFFLCPASYIISALFIQLCVIQLSMTLTYLKLNMPVHMYQPVDIALRFVVAIFIQQSCKFVLSTVQALPRQLHCECLGCTVAFKVLQDIPHLGVQVSVENREGGS